MPIEIRLTLRFEKEAKRLIKKYHSLKSELSSLESLLQKNPKSGTAIGKGFYKVRLSIQSKGKGKSGGARVITFLRNENSEVIYLTSIYDKSERPTITSKELQLIIKEITL